MLGTTAITASATICPLTHTRMNADKRGITADAEPFHHPSVNPVSAEIS
jgi:hypothetical protein